MKSLILIILLIFLTQNCSLEKVIKRHGINNLEKKVSKLEIGQTNKNNIFEILGPPSTKSLIDENILIYIEISKYIFLLVFRVLKYFQIYNLLKYI